MPEAFAQLGAAYQQNGQRPIPANWPRQNPASWADAPDPATGMTPRQLGQGVIGAGKEIPQLMRAALPQADVVGQTRNPMADTALGRVLNRYLFDPMTIRGPAQQTGARMMDVLSLLHGMSPAGMEEPAFDPRVPEYLSEGVPSRPYPRGAVGPEAFKVPEVVPGARMKPLYRRVPEGFTNPRDFFRVVKSVLTDEPYHVYDEFTGRRLGKFYTPEEVDKFIDHMIYAPPPEEAPKGREIQSWKWPYDDSPVSRDHRGLLSPRRPPKPFELDYSGSGGNGH